MTAAFLLLPKMMQDAATTVTIQNTFMKSTEMAANLDGKVIDRRQAENAEKVHCAIKTVINLHIYCH